MHRSSTLIVGPVGEPLTLAEVWKHLRLPELEDSEYVSTLITVARQFFEDHDDRKLLSQTWRLTLDRFPYHPHDSWWRHYGVIELPCRPVQVVNSIKYIDSDGNQQTLDPATYRVDLSSMLARITPAYGQYWPVTRWESNTVEIEYVCGYGDATTTPDASFDGTNYFLTLTPSWLTTWTPSLKTIDGFHVDFDTAAPAGATIDVLAQAGTPIQQLARFTADITENALSADIVFPSTLAVPSTIVGGVPAHLKQALLLLIGHFYENREDSLIGPGIQAINLPRGYDVLVGANRRLHV